VAFSAILQQYNRWYLILFILFIHSRLETFRDHYLAEFSPEALRRERGKVGWLGGREEQGEMSYAAMPSSGRQPPQ